MGTVYPDVLDALALSSVVQFVRARETIRPKDRPSRWAFPTPRPTWGVPVTTAAYGLDGEAVVDDGTGARRDRAAGGCLGGGDALSAAGASAKGGSARCSQGVGRGGGRSFEMSMRRAPEVSGDGTLEGGNNQRDDASERTAGSSTDEFEEDGSMSNSVGADTSSTLFEQPHFADRSSLATLTNRSSHDKGSVATSAGSTGGQRRRRTGAEQPFPAPQRRRARGTPSA